MNAVTYLRTSTKEQHAENQHPAIKAYCNEHGHQIVASVEEKDSAYKSGRQVGLQRIIDTVQNGRGFDAVIVWALDRLSR